MIHRKFFIFTFCSLIKITINLKEIQNKIAIVYQDKTNMNSSLTKNIHKIDSTDIFTSKKVFFLLFIFVYFDVLADLVLYQTENCRKLDFVKITSDFVYFD